VDTSAGVHIYRVLQEALNNVSRHSGGREAWVRLNFLSRALQLEVEDHGKGIPSSADRRQSGATGIGLVGMRERAELVGGRLELLQSPVQGEGTVVRLTVPRDRAEAHAG
jgi:signal transduction histidine kinase